LEVEWWRAVNAWRDHRAVGRSFVQCDRGILHDRRAAGTWARGACGECITSKSRSTGEVKINDRKVAIKAVRGEREKVGLGDIVGHVNHLIPLGYQGEVCCPSARGVHGNKVLGNTGVVS